MGLKWVVFLLNDLAPCVTRSKYWPYRINRSLSSMISTTSTNDMSRFKRKIIPPVPKGGGHKNKYNFPEINAEWQDLKTQNLPLSLHAAASTVPPHQADRQHPSYHLCVIPITDMMISTSEHWMSVRKGSTSSRIIILSRLSNSLSIHARAFSRICRHTHQGKILPWGVVSESISSKIHK